MIFTLFHLRTERVPPRRQFSFPIEKYGKLNKNNWKCRYRKSWFWYWIWCSYLFFCLDAKEPKDQVRIRTFGLTRLCPFFCLDAKEPKNQGSHYGGYGLGRCAKISENSPSAQTPRFFNAPLGRPLNASFVRPNQWTIDNSPFLIEKIVHCQFSIINCFGLVLVSVKRRNEVERPERRCLSRRRVCDAHSVTQWRSCSADAALTFWYFWARQKYECSIEIKIKHLYPYETIEKLYVVRIYP